MRGNRGAGASTAHVITRQSLPEALADSLRERILNGEFQAGEALVQEVIAKEYDVSRMPVREALRQLEASGLVSIKVHKGAVVTSVPVEQIKELFDLRALLECDILARAIPKLSDKDIVRSRIILTQLERSYRKRDIANWGRLNWDFHRSLYLAADRVQSLAVIQGINVQTDRYIRMQLFLTKAIGNAEREHRELLRLCAVKDCTRAVSHLQKHIAEAGRILIEALSADGAQRFKMIG